MQLGFFNWLRNKSPGGTRIQMVTERGNGFYAWSGKTYQSDIVRACLRPKVKAVGKLVGKHIRSSVAADGTSTLMVNPDAYMRFLLEEPNPYMSGQKLQEKLAAQLCLNGNAFALVLYNEDGLPVELYPIIATAAEAVYGPTGELYLRFTMQNGRVFTFPYSSVIHLRSDYNENDIFGDSIAPALAPLMEIVSTTDQGIVKAIKNGSVIRWLLKFTSNLRQEDIERETKRFADTFLSVSGGTGGVAAVDSKADAKQVSPQDYVPNAAQMDRTTERIYSLLNTNKKIVQSDYSEDDWNAYYEAEIEPVVIDLGSEYTRKLFSRKARGFGNKIMFEAANLATASMATKLNLCQLVDRGAMTPNEWRSVLNLAPLPGGDKPIRRLDTAPITALEKEDEE